MSFKLQVIEGGNCVAEQEVLEGGVVTARYGDLDVSVYEGGDCRRHSVAKLQGFRGKGQALSPIIDASGQEISPLWGRYLSNGEKIDFPQVPGDTVVVGNQGLYDDGVRHFQHEFKFSGVLKILC